MAPEQGLPKTNSRFKTLQPRVASGFCADRPREWGQSPNIAPYLVRAFSTVPFGW